MSDNPKIHQTTRLAYRVCAACQRTFPCQQHASAKCPHCGSLASVEVMERGSVNDWSKLDIRDGVIHYRVYQQDGTMQPMTAPNTMHNRQVISWIQIHDRM